MVHNHKNQNGSTVDWWKLNLHSVAYSSIVNFQILVNDDYFTMLFLEFRAKIIMTSHLWTLLLTSCNHRRSNIFTFSIFYHFMPSEVSDTKLLQNRWLVMSAEENMASSELAGFLAAKRTITVFLLCIQAWTFKFIANNQFFYFHIVCSIIRNEAKVNRYFHSSTSLL